MDKIKNFLVMCLEANGNYFNKKFHTFVSSVLNNQYMIIKEKKRKRKTNIYN